MDTHGGIAGHATSHVVFGWDPIWVSAILFLATYAAIVTDKVNRAVAALIGAGLMISLGVLNQETAIQGVDFNTLGLLTGMMVIVAITRRSGIFQFVAILVGQAGAGAPLGHPGDALPRHRRVLGVARQRHHRAPDRAGDPSHHRRAGGQPLSVPGRGDLRVQHRRHRDP